MYADVDAWWVIPLWVFSTLAFTYSLDQDAEEKKFKELHIQESSALDMLAEFTGLSDITDPLGLTNKEAKKPEPVIGIAMGLVVMACISLCRCRVNG